MNPKYTLERYRMGGANRYQCPQCGRRKCFTRYIDTDDHSYIADECGKCDHDNSCGYHLKPSQYFRLHPEARRLDWKEQIRRSAMPQQQPAAIVAEPPKSLPIGILPDGPTLVQRYHSPASTLAQWLRARVGEEPFQRVYEDYRLGATAESEVIYWQIDEQQRVRTGKLMRYHPDGHRAPERHPRWMHNFMPLPEGTTLSQCLFGEHLLTQHSERPVGLVESEKTALVCSALFPQYIWLATGGCKALSVDKLLPLQGRTLHVWPDSGSLEQWKATLDPVMHGQYHLYRLLEQYPPNTDLADLLLDDIL